MAMPGEVASARCPYGRCMTERSTSMQAMAETASRARIEEMSSPWALGDYDRFARALVWDLGPELVEACGIGPAQRVLDVAAGTGNVALRAAQAGAQVVASDVTRESLAVGERNARELGLEIEWVQADAQALPFANGEFDVVTSAVGAIFAPDHQAVADELLRVCRPGGMIGMVNFTPEGNAADFFGALAPTRRRRRLVRCRRSCGAARSTCASSSATASPRST
jgi:ubiquinone/menaquinone biosynthesis C-methylase UbiE